MGTKIGRGKSKRVIQMIKVNLIRAKILGTNLINIVKHKNLSN